MSLPYLQPYFGLSNSLQTAQAGGAGGAVGGWIELARTTLGSAGDSISVSSLADKRYYMTLVNTGASGTVTNFYQFNGDTGSNYAHRNSSDGGADSPVVNTTQYDVGLGLGTTPEFTVSYIANLSAKEKLIQTHKVRQNTAGAGNAPQRGEYVGKWANTSSVFNRIDAINNQSGDYPIGSEVVVLGWDPADTHTTNFWEELASVDQTSGANTLSSGVFTSKKYLWIQCYLDTNDGHDPVFRVGNTTVDTGSNYAFRRSYNGGADTPATSQGSLVIGNTLTNCFHNIFIVNNSANEKLIIYNGISVSTAGAGTYPERTEAAGKWANTSSQIDIVDFYKSTATYTGNLRVWGSD